MSAVSQPGESALRPIETAVGGSSEVGLPAWSGAASATQRLNASRVLLRQAMMAKSRPSVAARPGGHGVSTTVVEAMRHVPGAAQLVETMSSWWASHPLRDASLIAGQATGAMLRPVARDDPMKLLFCALVFGALLVVLKPWRFLLRSAIFAGLIPQLAKFVLKRVPMSTWLNLLSRSSKPARVGGSRPISGRRL